jgi:N,N'-diacetyllegionaminate synthase
MDHLLSREQVRVGDRHLGQGQPCLVIAEAGVNHNGDLALAHRLVDAAAGTGADCVKFQTFDPAHLASSSAPCAEYQREAGASTQRTMLEQLVLSPEAHRELAAHAADRKLIFLSSPFDESSADFLEQLGVPAFKIPSGEAVNHQFLAHLARKGRPLLLSTGMCDLAEVGRAVAVVREAGNPPLALLHCVSCYPADPADANLRAMDTLRAAFGGPVGYSDHTLGSAVAVAAVALGADLIEKHLTLDRTLPGPDHRASLEPEEFRRLVEGLRQAQLARGSGVKEPRPAEAAVAAVARKSLHWSASLEPGTRIESGHLTCLRPGTGLPPYRLAEVVGRRLRERVERGTLLRPETLEPPL